MSKSEYYDPRDDVEHEIEVGQVYVDDRQSDWSDDERDYWTIIYCDDERVYLRSNQSAGRGRTGHAHRGEERPDFESMVGAGRYKLRPDADIESTLESNEQSNSGDDIPFEDLPHLGATTAQRLREAGYSTRRDVVGASKDDITSISGIGAKGYESIMEYC